MKRLIIGIHGLGNKPPSGVLKQGWFQAINEGLRKYQKTTLRIPFELVYWADILHPAPQDPEMKDPHHPHYYSEPYLPRGKDNAPPVHSLKTKLLRYAERQLDRVFLNEDMSLNFSKVSDSIIRHYFQDLEAYYTHSREVNGNSFPVSNLVRERLSQALQAYSGCQIMLIAHSMGSIVAYDVLWALQKTVTTHTLVTVGSPLGLPAIQYRIHQEHRQADLDPQQLAAPPNIQKRWYNLSDPADHVALDHTLADDFGLNRQGLRAQDMEVYNDYRWGDQRNPHKIYGYLRTPELSGIIAQFQSRSDAGWWQRAKARWQKRNRQSH